jgi:hypothetical protein
MSDNRLQENESSESDDEPFNTKRIQSILTDLFEDLTVSIERVRNLRRQSKAIRKTLVVRELTKECQEIFKVKEASVQDILDFWIPLWKDEGRISGREIRMGEEARLIGLDPEKKVDIYDLYNLLDCLFV